MDRSLHRTSQGDIAFVETARNGPPVVLIHGNSSCKEVFRRQLQSPLFQDYRLIALDLPGHGDSADAADPQTYTLPGYANIVSELLRELGVEHPVLLGWSLGGHIALEMLATGANLAGVMAVGAPPVSPGILGLLRGLRPEIDVFLTGKADFTPKDTKRFAEICFGAAADEWLVRRIERTDPRTRTTISRSMMRGACADERWAVEHLDTPVAILNGSEEPFARQDYLRHLNYAHLWEGQIQLIQGAGHAPFLEAPDRFNPLLKRFLDYADDYRQRPAGAGAASA